MFSEQPSSFELLLARCQDTVDLRSIHIVEDAITYARWILRDGKLIFENLTATQKRCTELLLENRELKSKIDELQRR
jgi:hypothetical protein